MISVLGVSGSRKTPGVYVNSIIGGPGTSSGVAPTTCLLIASMIEVALSGAAPTFSTPAGTYLNTSATVLEKPVAVISADDAKTKFGQGSNLHLGAKAFFRQFPDGTLYCCPVALSAGASASASITFVGAATANGTIRIWVCGLPIDVAITSGDSVTTMATNVATAIALQFPDLPVTAQFLVGVMTVTAKHKGPNGNDTTFRAAWINGTNEITIGTSTAQFGTAATITGSGKLSGGTTQNTIANALTSIAAQPYDMIATEINDTTNINRLRDDLINKASPLTMYWGQGICCAMTSPSTTQTQAALVNDYRIQLACLENGDSLAVEVAAQIMAARLNGDGNVAGFHVGEDIDPAANLNGMLLASVIAQSNSDDWPTQTEVEAMLNNGVTPLVPSPEHPGYCKIVSSITTKHKDGTGFNYAASKTKVVTVTDYVSAAVRQRYIAKYMVAGFKLADDDPDGNGVEIERVVTPSIISDDTLELLRLLERNGVITAVDSFLDQLKFVIDSGNRGRVNCNIPAFPIPDLDIIACNVRQVSL